MHKQFYWDFLGGPVVKTLHFTAETTGSVSGWATKMLHTIGGQEIEGKKKNLKIIKKFYWTELYNTTKELRVIPESCGSIERYLQCFHLKF